MGNLTVMSMYRQGDVLLISLPRTPTLGAEMPITGLGPVLALGEITGHHHTVVANPITYNVFEDLGAEPVRGNGLTLREIAKNYIGDCLKLHKALADVDTAQPAARLYEMTEGNDRTLVVTRHTILRHDEHTPIMLAPGAYKVRIQQEWFGNEARRVTD